MLVEILADKRAALALYRNTSALGKRTWALNASSQEQTLTDAFILKILKRLELFRINVSREVRKVIRFESKLLLSIVSFFGKSQVEKVYFRITGVPYKKETLEESIAFF